ncbi:MAG: hypothetical protein LPK00_09305 [Bacillaceae bacterium]|nr:hypothetical protein [Bacillaceae bacterium]
MTKLKIRVGVVGPSDSVKEMMKVGLSFKDLTFIPFPYNRTEDTEQIILENGHSVDQWLFSGQAPYFFSLNKGIISELNASYIPLQGSSFLSTLLEAFITEGKIFSNLSLDTIHQEEIEKSMNDNNVKNLTIQYNSYHGYLPPEGIITYHKNLFDEGNTEVAITCIRSVYEHLKDLNIPVYRVVPSELAINRVLEQVKEKGQSSWYKKAQLVIVGIEMIELESETEMDDHHYSFKTKHRALEMQRVLLDFTEEVNGSIVKIGDGLHFIYTTRGEVELYQKTHSLQEVINQVYINSKLQVRIGVGFGLTVLEAEQNVRRAFDHARGYNEPVVIEVTEDKEVLVGLDKAEKITFQTRNTGAVWEKHFKHANISSTIVSKIESLSNHYNQTVLTSQDLSRWLKSTERNARRILTELDKLDLAVVSGEETGQRGRPRKIYKLQFEKLQKLLD